MADNMFSKVDFGPLKKYLDDDDITDISFSNNEQLHLKSLTKGNYRVENNNIVTNQLVEKLAFQCANVMGKSFNMANPFLDAEGEELRLNFVHDSIAKNGVAVVMRKTPAKIRLKKEKILEEEYILESLHDFLLKAVLGHCNIVVCGETGSGKTEFVKYLAAHTKENEKIITIEDTLELHLDRIFPHRDIVAMKTNNIASYSEVLVTCMRQNPKWILLSEVRSAEAVTAVRNSISSGHNILTTIHADKAQSVPDRMYSLLESNLEVDQFLKTIYRYVQIAVFIRGYYSPERKRFHRELGEVCEFYVNEDNEPVHNVIYKKTVEGVITTKPVSKHLLDYIQSQGIRLTMLDENNELIIKESEEGSEGTVRNEKIEKNVENEKIEKNIENVENIDFFDDDFDLPEEKEIKIPEKKIIKPTVDDFNREIITQPKVELNRSKEIKTSPIMREKRIENDKIQPKKDIAFKENISHVCFNCNKSL